MIGFIGAGNMARSLAGGLIAQGIAPQNILMSDTQATALEQVQQTLGVQTTLNNATVIQQAHTVILALKPQGMKKLLESIQTTAQTARPLLISIAAGISCASLHRWLGQPLPLVRCMPNTPALVQMAATALYATTQTTTQQRQQAEQILSAVGLAVWVEEEIQLDAVTALSGSGPAYFFYLMEAMIQAGEKMGLSATLSQQLTLQTALGAAYMAQHSKLDPATLRAQVTSPGGTTAAALAVLEQQQVANHFIAALKAAQIRASELAEQADA